MGNQGGQCRVNVHQGTENLARTAGLAMGQGHLQVIQGELHPSPPNRRRIYPPSGHSVSKRTSLQMSKSCRTCTEACVGTSSTQHRYAQGVGPIFSISRMVLVVHDRMAFCPPCFRPTS